MILEGVVAILRVLVAFSGLPEVENPQGKPTQYASSILQIRGRMRDYRPVGSAEFMRG
jgi:hypothetical protein